MEQIFITSFTIEKVRHLRDIFIPLSENHLKHLILTGKNGSGKTSVVEALAGYLENVFSDANFERRADWLENAKKKRDIEIQKGAEEGEIIALEQDISQKEVNLTKSRKGLELNFNHTRSSIFGLKEKYHYILAYYKADRTFHAVQPEHVEKVKLKDHYGLEEFPRNEFVKYLLDLKTVEAFARLKNAYKAEEIQAWFMSLEQLLQKIFDDGTLTLEFDEETFEFHILQQGKEPFDFNTMSGGYQAVLDIVADLIMRMASQTGRSFAFHLPGIVLIDEIETHLHLELQKNIMPLLAAIFPNIQFIVTSHSPFILNSLKNAVIYDLENHVLVEHGLDDVPYDGIVEGYFGADKLSDSLKEKFEQYKVLVKKGCLSEEELDEIAELEVYLNEIPDYLALDLTTEYQRLKIEFMSRGDLDG
ncbi:MAG: AAA family ATPase [Lachnospiraceae bacterium]|nr:AAA family ATPase [Lachnospiraceae bacterium]